MRRSIALSASVVLAACAKSPAGPPAALPEPAAETAPGDTAAAAEPPPAAEGGAERPSVSAADCEAQGGKVVGDIGDGAIHRPDFRCPESGAAPIGTIAADPGGPAAVEGAVCCK